MKSLLTCVAVAIVLGIAGCQGEMRNIISLDNQATTQPMAQSIAVTEKGTYYLYSSKNGNTPIYQTDLKKGDELGFRVNGDRARATAKGIVIELSEYSEGASYVWKLEEKKKE